MPTLVERTATILRLNGERWRALATGIDRELLVRRPAEGEWSALECLRHATDTEDHVFAARIRALLAGDDFAAFDPDAEGTPITDDTHATLLAEAHAAKRAVSIDLVESLTEADLDHTGRHPELGPVTLGELLSEWWAHDTMHLVQAERALMQPFIVAAGPWRVYFADHDVTVG